MILPRLFLQNPPKRRPADAKSFSSFGFVHVFLLQDDPGDVIVNTVQILVQVQDFIAWLKLEGILGTGAFLGEGLTHNVSFDIVIIGGNDQLTNDTLKLCQILRPAKLLH